MSSQQDKWYSVLFEEEDNAEINPSKKYKYNFEEEQWFKRLYFILILE